MAQHIMTFEVENGLTKAKIDGIYMGGGKAAKVEADENQIKDVVEDTVKANPTLVGDEPNLEGLEVSGDKYVVSDDSQEIADLQEDVATMQLKFINVTADTWVSDTTYTDYPYACTLTCTGVTSDLVVDVIFDTTEATSGNYAPVCLSGTDSVTIYSKVNTSITIPVIKVV